MDSRSRANSATAAEVKASEPTATANELIAEITALIEEVKAAASKRRAYLKHAAELKEPTSSEMGPLENKIQPLETEIIKEENQTDTYEVILTRRLSHKMHQLNCFQLLKEKLAKTIKSSMLEIYNNPQAKTVVQSPSGSFFDNLFVSYAKEVLAASNQSVTTLAFSNNLSDNFPTENLGAISKIVNQILKNVLKDKTFFKGAPWYAKILINNIQGLSEDKECQALVGGKPFEADDAFVWSQSSLKLEQETQMQSVKAKLDNVRLQLSEKLPDLESSSAIDDEKKEDLARRDKFSATEEKLAREVSAREQGLDAAFQKLKAFEAEFQQLVAEAPAGSEEKIPEASQASKITAMLDAARTKFQGEKAEITAKHEAFKESLRAQRELLDVNLCALKKVLATEFRVILTRIAEDKNSEPTLKKELLKKIGLLNQTDYSTCSLDSLREQINLTLKSKLPEKIIPWIAQNFTQLAKDPSYQKYLHVHGGQPPFVIASKQKQLSWDRLALDLEKKANSFDLPKEAEVVRQAIGTNDLTDFSAIAAELDALKQDNLKQQKERARLADIQQDHCQQVFTIALCKLIVDIIGYQNYWSAQTHLSPVPTGVADMRHKLNQIANCQQWYDNPDRAKEFIKQAKVIAIKRRKPPFCGLFSLTRTAETAAFYKFLADLDLGQLTPEEITNAKAIHTKAKTENERLEGPSLPSAAPSSSH